MGLIDSIKKKKDNLNNAKKLCLDKYISGDISSVEGAIGMLYNQNHKDGIAVLQHIAKNTVCNEEPKVKKSKELKEFWEKLDKSSYDKYQIKLKKDYLSDIQKLNTSCLQKYLDICENATKTYQNNKSNILSEINNAKQWTIKFYRGSYYSDIYLNKNDMLINIVAMATMSCFFPIRNILVRLYQASNNNNISSFLKELDKIIDNNFQIKSDAAFDDICTVAEKICSQSTLKEIIDKFNKVFDLLSKFKI